MDITQLFNALSGISDNATLQTVIKDAKFVIALFEANIKLQQVRAAAQANPQDPLAQQINQIIG